MGIGLDELLDTIKPLKINLPVNIGKIEGFSIDSRTIKKGEVFIALKGERFDGNDFALDAIEKGALFAIVEREIDRPFVLVDDSMDAMKRLAALNLKKSPAVSVAVVGSVGKTTTKELLALFLECCGSVHKSAMNENNVIGVAKTLLGLKDEDFCVVEVGINQKGEMEEISSFFKPDVVLFLNVGDVHLEFLKSREGVFEEKSKIVSENSFVIYNADDDLLRERFRNSRFVGFGFEYGDMIGKLEDKMVVVDRVSVAARDIHPYNLLSALSAVLTLCRDVDNRCLQAKADSFKPLGYRMRSEFFNSVEFILDCYNANPQSMRYALNKLAERKGKKLAVLGDMLELGEYSERLHREIGIYAAGFDFDMICIGRDAFFICNEFERRSKKKARFFSDKEEAIDFLGRVFSVYDVILLKASRGLRFEEIYSEITKGEV